MTLGESGGASSSHGQRNHQQQPQQQPPDARPALLGLDKRGSNKAYPDGKDFEVRG